MRKISIKIDIEDYDIILASSSPRRESILSKIDLKFISIPSDTVEDVSIKLPPEEFCKHWAREKALNIAKAYPKSYILGADTIVVLDNKILGKPKDRDHSISMLKSLSGKTHKVLTGVSIIKIDSGVDALFNTSTYVTIRTLTNSDICNYIDTHSPFDKSGSYGIQGGFSIHVKKIDGCFYNVMGLPISEFYKHFLEIRKKDLKINDSN